MPRGTGEQIINAFSAEDKDAALANIGAKLMFDEFGINPFLLSGDISEKTAASKLETYLQFKPGSWDTSAPNINSIPKFYVKDHENDPVISYLEFAKAFAIPLDGAKGPSGKTYTEKEMRDLETNRSKNYSEHFDMEQAINLRILELKSFPEILLNNPDSVKRMAEIDAPKANGGLGLKKDTTFKFLTQQITPDQYLDALEKVIINTEMINATEFAKTICNQNKDCQTQFVNAYNSLWTPWQANSDKKIEDWKPEDRKKFFNGLTIMFSIDLDAKANLPPGTSIIPLTSSFSFR
ncbi:MAG: hypothetical protein CEN91_494 [Candidatus Berkelbacteria bacterium Licking1014_85]|uniref:Uncharacterized protein n=1 Tax=Candidatus Berkelbacteria bacterium Licking1014_85 TaxID=2017148 RepID=A0A554LHF1_9BACT|nr:MAG: hypothetical protein CEN91_494 [Candidatus Berkelbacteria bacterium Licking1014_85]